MFDKRDRSIDSPLVRVIAHSLPSSSYFFLLFPFLMWLMLIRSTEKESKGRVDRPDDAHVGYSHPGKGMRIKAAGMGHSLILYY